LLSLHCAEITVSCYKHPVAIHRGVWSELMTILGRVRTLVVFPVALAGLFFVLAAPKASEASSITYTFNAAFNGTAPTSTTPWLTLAFTDVAGGVELKATSSLEVGTEFIDEVTFNTTTAFTLPTTLAGSFGDWAKTLEPTCGSGGTSGWCFVYTPNGETLSGSGNLGSGFDVRLIFDNAPSNIRFDGTDSATFLLTGTGLTAQSFLSKSVNGRNDGYYVGAHIQGIPVAGGRATTSGAAFGVPEPVVPESVVPEPASLLMLGSGLGALGGYLRRRRATRA